jgi:hypothetical protein
LIVGAMARLLLIVQSSILGIILRIEKTPNALASIIELDNGGYSPFSEVLALRFMRLLQWQFGAVAFMAKTENLIQWF